MRGERDITFKSFFVHSAPAMSHLNLLIIHMHSVHLKKYKKKGKKALKFLL